MVGTGLNAIYHAHQGRSVPIVRTNVTVIMMQHATPSTEDVNASRVSPGPDAKSSVPRVIGAKTATEHANAKTPITYAILYKDAYVDQDLMVSKS